MPCVHFLPQRKVGTDIIGLYLYFYLCGKHAYVRISLVFWDECIHCIVPWNSARKYFCCISFGLDEEFCAHLTQVVSTTQRTVAHMYSAFFKVKDDGIWKMKVMKEQVWNWWSPRILLAWDLRLLCFVLYPAPPFPLWIRYYGINEIILP